MLVVISVSDLAATTVASLVSATSIGKLLDFGLAANRLTYSVLSFTLAPASLCGLTQRLGSVGVV